MNFSNWKRISRCLASALVVGLLMATGSSAHAQAVGLRIMPLGDSITAGYRSTTGNGFRGPLWTELNSKKHAFDLVGSQRGGPMFDPNNEGYYGYRIDQIAALVNNELANYHPNVILLDIGINDLGQNHDVSTAPDRLASLIDQVFTADPTVTLLVAQLIPNTTAWVETDVVSFNAQLADIVQTRATAGRHIAMVDMSAITTADLEDGLHPNDTGYQLMADAWTAGIQKAVATGWVAPIRFPGDYEIKSVGSSLALSTSGDSTANAAPVVQLAFADGPSQFWSVIPTSNGYYQIVNTNSGADLNVSAASKASGASVVLWPFGTQGNDQWRLEKQPDGGYVIYNLNSGLVLEDPGSSTTAGTQLDQASSVGGPYQEFRLIPQVYSSSK